VSRDRDHRFVSNWVTSPAGRITGKTGRRDVNIDERDRKKYLESKGKEREVEQSRQIKGCKARAVLRDRDHRIVSDQLT